MNHTVYFADKIVTFTSQRPHEEWFAVINDGQSPVSRAKIAKILETQNCVAVIGPDPGQALGAFAADFTLVEAAGGVVLNDCGEWLMILRKGRWDFPKGHLEFGERIDQCAVREVEEETGVACEVVRPLCTTLHAYNQRGRWELKRTHWYELRAVDCGVLRPQAEEGIEAAAWCSAPQVAANLRSSYPTIRRVVEMMQGR